MIIDKDYFFKNLWEEMKLSKKETEFDRYERMKKLEKEAEVAKRKSADMDDENRKKGGKPKMGKAPKRNNWNQNYALAMGEDEFYDDAF